MDRPSKISVIIPCYNREKYVGDSIESALAQRYENKEIIVVNDGSTDTSGDVIRSYADRVISFCTENRGVSAARNIGIRAARGEYVMFLDSDDRLEADCFAKFVSAHTDANKVLVGKCDTIDVLGRATGLNTYKLSEFPIHEKFPELQIVAELPMNMSCLIPRHLLLEVGGYNEEIIVGEDYDLNLRLLDEGAEFWPIPAYVYQYRVHRDSRLSKTFTSERYDRIADLFERAWVRWKEQFTAPENQKWKVLFARRIWSHGRSAYRARQRECGNRLTSIAFEIAERRAWVGSSVIKALYRVLPPYEAEWASERVKSGLRAGC